MQELFRHALEQQLAFLNERMKEMSDTANAFLNKYYFGGMIAVIAVLNLDLVLIEQPTTLTVKGFLYLGLLAIVVLGISELYFSKVIEHYQRFSVSNRKLKYKYELTLHALMTGAANVSWESTTFGSKPFPFTKTNMKNVLKQIANPQIMAG